MCDGCDVGWRVADARIVIGVMSGPCGCVRCCVLVCQWVVVGVLVGWYGCRVWCGVGVLVAWCWCGDGWSLVWYRLAVAVVLNVAAVVVVRLRLFSW